ncbi:hypothetical protein Asp14428_24550 [Actinoplanes sp. NBRC 14428]|nr:hypothetical protein Asp14428_24550 [Actinoplanes sp. NBRC 14428]
MLTVVGLVELGLGFFAAGVSARTAETVVTVLAGAAAIRGVADLVASLRLREASSLARAGRRLELSPERAIGVAGYSAGMTDFEAAPPRAAGARHRAMPRGSAAGLTDLSGPRTAAVEGSPGAEATGYGAAGIGAGAGGFGTAGVDAEGGWGTGTGTGTGVAGSGTAGTGARGIGAGGPAGTGAWGIGAGGTAGSGARGMGAAGAAGSGAGGFAAGPGAAGGGTGDWREAGHGAQAGSFHDEVLRTTAELDAMLALAGVTGAAVPGAAAQAAAAEAEQVEVPDTAEGVEVPGADEAMASPQEPGRAARAAATGAVSGAAGDAVAFDGTEPGARAAGRDDGRTVD